MGGGCMAWTESRGCPGKQGGQDKFHQLRSCLWFWTEWRITPDLTPPCCDLSPQPGPCSEGHSLLSLDAFSHAHLVWPFIGCSLWGKTKAGFPPLFYGCICHIADVAPFLASLITDGLTILPSSPSPCLICIEREPRFEHTGQPEFQCSWGAFWERSGHQSISSRPRFTNSSSV